MGMEGCFFFSSRRRHTRYGTVTGVQTCALPICSNPASKFFAGNIPLSPLWSIFWCCICKRRIEILYFRCLGLTSDPYSPIGRFLWWGEGRRGRRMTPAIFPARSLREAKFFLVQLSSFQRLQLCAIVQQVFRYDTDVAAGINEEGYRLFIHFSC